MSPTRLPRVSIGVPAYNAERYLARSLDSLLEQSFSDIEIVVCDNASSDETGAIARRYAERDPRVRYERNPVNIGAGRNFIRCVELARGELFRWQSADDLSAPTFVQRCVEVLDAHPDVIQAYPRCTLIDEHGEELEPYVESISTLSDVPAQRYLHVMQHLGLVNALYGVMRIDALRRTAVHGVYVGADLVVQAELALYGKLWEIPEQLFFRRMHAQAHSAMTLEQKQAFYTPSARHRPSLMRWRHLGERLRSVARSPLPIVEQVHLAGALLRSAIGSREEFARELWIAFRDRVRRGRTAEP